MKSLNPIYEKDCPTEESALLYKIFGSFRGVRSNTDRRFKPNGVTDNRRDYYHAKNIMGAEFSRQRRFAKEDYQIDLMMGKIKITQ